MEDKEDAHAWSTRAFVFGSSRMISNDRQDHVASSPTAWWLRIVTGRWLHAGFIGTSIGAGRVAAMLAGNDRGS